MLRQTVFSGVNIIVHHITQLYVNETDFVSESRTYRLVEISIKRYLILDHASCHFRGLKISEMVLARWQSFQSQAIRTQQMR